MSKQIKNTSLIFECLTVIIRSAGERTTDLCKKMIEGQGYSEKIYVTSEVPFSAAVKKAFEIGISENKKWTFCVDADVLLRKKSLKSLIQFADVQAKNSFVIQGLVSDKFFPWPREAGNHFYRTSMLNEALQFIPDEGEDIRPESFLIRSMSEKGYPKVTFPSVIGLHDFEQYYLDIFRKSFVQSHKHLNYAEEFIPYWKKYSEDDQDYRIALAAFSEGIGSNENVYINKQQKLYEDKFNDLKLKEKDEICIESWDLSRVENILKEELGDGYEKLIPEEYSSNLIEKSSAKYRKYGFLKTVVLGFGLLLIKTGQKIKNSIMDDRN